eukprot:TRINITY_DN11218_c0_g1_i2.p2 TRINITY_DN11218_c0_g1~~TRINITY_DN11218_c0_g1_i2.p2  ORF type:complete len:262 (+),score=26.61 TRINITY_DN11218_c0_g1_i2:31-786(+)
MQVFEPQLSRHVMVEKIDLSETKEAGTGNEPGSPASSVGPDDMKPRPMSPGRSTSLGGVRVVRRVLPTKPSDTASLRLEVERWRRIAEQERTRADAAERALAARCEHKDSPPASEPTRNDNSCTPGKDNELSAEVSQLKNDLGLSIELLREQRRQIDQLNKELETRPECSDAEVMTDSEMIPTSPSRAPFAQPSSLNWNTRQRPGFGKLGGAAAAVRVPSLPTAKKSTRFGFLHVLCAIIAVVLLLIIFLF